LSKVVISITHVEREREKEKLQRGREIERDAKGTIGKRYKYVMREKLDFENRCYGKQHIPSKCHQFFTCFFKGKI